MRKLADIGIDGQGILHGPATKRRRSVTVNLAESPLDCAARAGRVVLTLAIDRLP